MSDINRLLGLVARPVPLQAHTTDCQLACNDNICVWSCGQVVADLVFKDKRSYEYAFLKKSYDDQIKQLDYRDGVGRQYGDDLDNGKYWD